ncbi:hypothetical protein QOZ80_1AG0027150 [Eleusine coracana subsp. coracana]|nr:hypothetical protein QOZ80_1AG0027150 [Eleusine coracana subsp. coracana]
MIGEENEQAENEQADSGSSFKKSKLSSLVKGFHDDYQYLHKHYKQLIGKLENVGHSSSGSDSSDSDTEGDKSDNDTTVPRLALVEENGWKHRLAEIHNMEAEIEKLKQNTEEQAKEISDLKELLDKSIMDKEATTVELSSEVANLSSQNENLKSLVESAERKAAESLKGLASMENHIKTLSNEKQIIENERYDLKISVADMEKERKNLSNQLKETVDKCALLSSELEKARLAENEVQTLVAENQKLKNSNLMRLAEHRDLKAQLQNFDMECSKLGEIISETKAENESLIKEKHIVQSKVEQLEMDIDVLRAEKEELVDNFNKKLRTAAKEKERLVSDHSKCLDELEMARSNAMELENELESTKRVLNGNILDLQNEKNSAASEIKQLEASVKNLDSQLEQQLEKISDMQKTNEALVLANSNLQNEIIEIQGEKNEALASIVNLESELEQKGQHISNLEEANKDLEAAKTDLYSELTVHQEEKTAALVQLQQLEDNLKSLQSELEQQHKQMSVLQHINEELQDTNSSLHRQLEESRTNLQDEIIALEREREEVVNNLQQSNASIKTLEGELEQQSEQLSVLQLAHEDLQEGNTKLKIQLEETMVSHRAEVLALQDEKNKILSELQQSEASIETLKTELEQEKEQISILHLANEDLKNNIAGMDKQLEEVRSSLHAEIAAVHEEKDAALLELQASQASVSNFETVVEKQSENISSLQHANDELQKNICTLTEQSEQAKAELHEEIKAMLEEKDTIVTQLKQSESFIKNLENEVARLTEELSVQLENNSTLDKQLEEATLKVSNLREKLEKSQAQAASHIDDMTTKTKDLENTINVLSSQKTKVEEDLKILVEACSSNMSLMKEFEDTAKQRITDHETRLGPLYQSLRGVLSRCQKLHYAYDEMSTWASQLEVLKENQMEQINQLQKKNNEILDKNHMLEEENLNANKENTKLYKHAQDLEVQLQLAKQKLKVTEAESKCKEDSYATVVTTSQAEIQHLEQLVQQFSGRVRLLEEILVQVKEHTESGVSSLAEKLDELESFFVQGFARIVDRSSACSEELKVLRNKLHDYLDEQKELLKEKHEMAIRLRDKENVLLEMVKNAAEAEKKVAHLEKKVEEKEEELEVRVQEKREAIKQLSDAIIYHKNNSDDLVRYIRSNNRPRLPFCM